MNAVTEESTLERVGFVGTHHHRDADVVHQLNVLAAIGVIVRYI